MPRYLNDSDGDSISLHYERDGLTVGAMQASSQGIPAQSAYVGPIDPHALIEAIKEECELHEDDEVHDEEPKRSPVDTFTITGKMIDTGRLSVRFKDSEPLRAMEPDEEPETREQYVHTTPATAEDGKERTEAHQHLSEHWERRLKVVEQALKIARFAADEDRDILGVDR